MQLGIGLLPWKSMGITNTHQLGMIAIGMIGYLYTCSSDSYGKAAARRQEIRRKW